MSETHRSLRGLTSQDFTPLLHQAFSLEAGASGALGMELVEVTEQKRHRAGEKSGLARVPFSIVFLVSTEGYVPQGIYRVENRELGSLEIFLVPIGRKEGGLLLEAVFN